MYGYCDILQLFVLKEFVCWLPEDGEITPKHVGAV